jgi:glycosyltransferase involved in cell wall biosynthesis
LDQNGGKAQAIRKGLAGARENNILLFDADLEEIDMNQLDATIAAFTSSSWLDMIILRRMNDLLLCRSLRIDIVLSGERLLRRCDLQHALETNPLGYQLELAINRYMHEHGKSVCWMPLSSRHMIKVAKSGLASGLVKEMEQHVALMNYKGTAWYLWNLATFCFPEFRYQRAMTRLVARAHSI